MWQIYGFEGELLADYRAMVHASGPEKEYGYRNGQLLVTATGRLNVAAAANGAVATASSAHTCCGFSTTGAINGNFRGPWGNGEGWNDATENVVPDWIQVDFAGSKTIDEINVFSLHDNYTQENNPTLTQTFTLHGLIAFNVQYWNGSTWVTIPGGTVTGNNKVWRNFAFSAITTSKIRVFINQVPDAWSRVVEIQALGTSAGGDKVQWLVADHLGTPRIIVDETANRANVKRHDYLPFGEELFAGTGGRTAALGYAGDGVRQQFTSQERDIETGLDYFLARYYSSTQGRFLSVDPLLSSARLRSPQSWNRYSYVLNNPLGLIDPTGMVDQDPQKDTTGGFIIQGACKELKPGCGIVLLTTVTVPLERDTTALTTTDVVPVTHLQIMTGIENPFPQKGAMVSAMDAIADSDGTGVMAGTSVAVRSPTGAAGAAAAVGGVIASALLYDFGRSIADTIARWLPRRSEDVVSLYRGVPANHPGHILALAGMAAPIGGHEDAARHNRGDTNSVFTSWTTDPAVAARYARSDGPGGVVLFKQIPRVQTVPSPDIFNEREVLVVGPVSGAHVRILP